MHPSPLQLHFLSIKSNTYHLFDSYSLEKLAEAFHGLSGCNISRLVIRKNWFHDLLDSFTADEHITPYKMLSYIPTGFKLGTLSRELDAQPLLH